MLELKITHRNDCDEQSKKDAEFLRRLANVIDGTETHQYTSPAAKTYTVGETDTSEKDDLPPATTEPVKKAEPAVSPVEGTVKHTESSPVPVPPVEVTEPLPTPPNALDIATNINLEGLVRIEGDQRFIGDVEVDINNLPHDNRIFTDNRSKLKDGSWRLKRESARQDHDVEAVKEQLKATMLANVGAMGATVTEPVKEAEPATPAVPTPPAPPSVPTPPPVVEPEESVLKKASEMTFPEAVAEFANYQTAGHITMQDIETITQKHGVDNIGLLANAPAIIPTVVREVRAMLPVGA